MGQHDAELVRRWQQGDAAAFEVLVRRWQQPVARFLARLVGRGGPAPDLCQEGFLRVYLAGPRYREAGTFSTWLYRIALNVARDAGGRRRARSSRASPPPWPGCGRGCATWTGTTRRPTDELHPCARPAARSGLR